MPTYRLDPEATTASGDLIVGDASQRRRDKILIGKLVESGPRRDLWLDVSGEQVVAIFGKRGTGKSYTLGALLEGLAAGAGSTPCAEMQTRRTGLVFDIMDIYWTSTIPLAADGPAEIVKQYQFMKKAGFKAFVPAVDVWVPAGFKNDEIDPPTTTELRLTASDLSIDDWGELFDLDVYSEPRGMLIADLVTKVSAKGYKTTDGLQRLPNKTFSIPDLIDCLDSDDEIIRQYRDDTMRSIRQRLTSYSLLPLFQGVGTKLNELLKNFRVSILMLGRLPDALKRVLVSVLLKRIMRERHTASFAQKRLDLDSALTPDKREDLVRVTERSIPRTWVLLDEAHVLAGAERASIATEALVKYAKEGRNYGLSLAVATQQPSALDPRLTSQAETLIVHQLTSPRDASIATDNLRSPLPSECRIDGQPAEVGDLVRRVGQGEAVFSCANAPTMSRICVIGVRPRVTAHGGYEA